MPSDDLATPVPSFRLPRLLALLLVPLGLIGRFWANAPIGVLGLSPLVTGWHLRVRQGSR